MAPGVFLCRPPGSGQNFSAERRGGSKASSGAIAGRNEIPLRLASLCKRACQTGVCQQGSTVPSIHFPMLFTAPFLKLRQKIADKRARMHDDEEKPFLDHLEDLRVTITRMLTALIIGLLACLAFQNTFVDIVKYPIKLAGLNDMPERNVPDAVGDADWKIIRATARGAAGLPEAQRDVFLSEMTAGRPDLRHAARALTLWHALAGLPEAKRTDLQAKLIAQLPEAERAPVGEAITKMVKAETSPSLEEPPPVLNLQFLKPAGSFMNAFKLSIYAALIVTFPFLFYFLMQFILPGLTPKEKSLLWPALGIGCGLFLMGVMFAYWVVVPKALRFFTEFTLSQGPEFRDSWTMDDYTSFVCSFAFIFGIGFELPVVVLSFVKLDLLTSRTMRDKRAWAVLIIAIVSAVLTPTPDAPTMLLLCGPLILMYEACIWIAYFMEKKAARLEEEERQRDMARRASIMDMPPASTERNQQPSHEGSNEPKALPSLVPAAGIATASAGGYSSSSPGEESPPDDAVSRHLDDPFHGDEEVWHEPVKPIRHPHHEHDEIDMDEQMEIYRREHAHLFDQHETHPENIPVEERGHAEAPEDPEPVDADPPAAEPVEEQQRAEAKPDAEELKKDAEKPGESGPIA